MRPITGTGSARKRVASASSTRLAACALRPDREAGARQGLERQRAGADLARAVDDARP